MSRRPQILSISAPAFSRLSASLSDIPMGVGNASRGIWRMSSFMGWPTVLSSCIWCPVFDNVKVDTWGSISSLTNTSYQPRILLGPVIGEEIDDPYTNRLEGTRRAVRNMWWLNGDV
jgi:hypothetical protein